MPPFVSSCINSPCYKHNAKFVEENIIPILCRRHHPIKQQSSLQKGVAYWCKAYLYAPHKTLSAFKQFFFHKQSKVHKLNWISKANMEIFILSWTAIVQSHKKFAPAAPLFYGNIQYASIHASLIITLNSIFPVDLNEFVCNFLFFILQPNT